MLAEEVRDIPAIEPGHHDVHQDQVGLEMDRCRQGNEGIVFSQDAVAPGPLQVELEKTRESLFVIDDENPWKVGGFG